MKKITAFVLAITMVCSMLIVAHAVEPRTAYIPCSCGGEIAITVLSSTDHIESTACTHGNHNQCDEYYVVTEHIRETCSSCGYSDTYYETTRTLLYCPAE